MIIRTKFNLGNIVFLVVLNQKWEVKGKLKIKNIIPVVSKNADRIKIQIGYYLGEGFLEKSKDVIVREQDDIFKTKKEAEEECAIRNEMLESKDDGYDPSMNMSDN